MNKTLILLLLLAIQSPSFAQTLSSLKIKALERDLQGSAGKTMTTQNYIVDFAIGEAITNVVKTDSIMLTQGFHQAAYLSTPKNKQTLNEVEVVEFSEGELSAYPNPCQTTLNITYSFIENQELAVSVYDGTGKLLLNFDQDYTKGVQQLDFSNYSKGVYFIKFLNQENLKSKTFKIIKS
ncbi:T9SS type A sorting domain-containing protein [Mangrovibacterium lignilyticum]|uniref:T9SS type A sorting domain-containing protein n=1 Tax=Mangrovibacterium lignilyticum TaxID=2668052 RepID=UPI0013D60E88|nr:T9SS type A sorting domain-containing protein [Mangrovibacterium lignilyticum]